MRKGCATQQWLNFEFFFLRNVRTKCVHVHLCWTEQSKRKKGGRKKKGATGLLHRHVFLEKKCTQAFFPYALPRPPH